MKIGKKEPITIHNYFVNREHKIIFYDQDEYTRISNKGERLFVRISSDVWIELLSEDASFQDLSYLYFPEQENNEKLVYLRSLSPKEITNTLSCYNLKLIESHSNIIFKTFYISEINKYLCISIGADPESCRDSFDYLDFKENVYDYALMYNNFKEVEEEYLSQKELLEEMKNNESSKVFPLSVGYKNK